jgi:hypothetical protein
VLAVVEYLQAAMTARAQVQVQLRPL